MKKNIHILLTLLLIFGYTLITSAENVTTLPDLEIATEKQPSSKEIVFSAIPQKADKIIVLKVRLFYKTAVPRGWNSTSSIRLNGKILGRKTASGSERLLRRGGFMKLADEERAWFDKNNGLLIMSGPGEGELDKRILAPRKEGYWYYLDISDLVFNTKQNRLQFRNGLIAAFTGGENNPLVAKNMEIIYLDKSESIKAKNPVSKPTGTNKKNTGNINVRTLPKGKLSLPDIEVPLAQQPSSCELTFPAIPKERGKVPVLKARIFYAAPAPSGWNSSSSISLNGSQLGRYTASGNERLLRRGEFMKLADEERAWFDKSNGLLLLFGPGSGELDKRILMPRQEGYWYYLEIGDLVHFVETGFDGRIESEKKNVLRVHNGLTLKLAGELNHPLTVRDMEIVYMTPEELAKVQLKPATRTVKPSAVKAFMTQGTAKVSVTADGGLILEKNGERYYWSAAFSYPSSHRMQYDSLSPDKSKGRDGWKPVVLQNEDGSISVTASASGRKVTRTLKFNGDFLEVVDTVGNLTEADVGMNTCYAVTSEAELSTNAVYLAGMKETTKESGCGANPTVYLQGEKSGIGVMALDAAFRCHLELFKTASNCVEMRHPTALAFGENYSQKYLLLLTDKGDYFAFLNAVRRHLNLNRTINGPLVLGVQYVNKDRQIRITTESFYTDWFEYGTMKSLELPREKYKEMYQAGVTRHRQQYPGIKVLPKMEMSPRYLDKRKIQHASLLPDSGKALVGTYGEVVSKEATEVLEKETPYGDSILRTADGRAIIDTYYPAEPEMSILVYPYKNNAHQKNLLDQADFLLNVVGTDGIYIDQYAPGSMFSLSGSRDRVSFDRWDGRTVELNPDGTIKRKMFDIAYACAEARIQFIRNVLDKDKIFLANTQPVTTEEADAGGYRFYESDSENLAPMLSGIGKPGMYRLQAFSQLSPSPMILGTRPGIFFNDSRNWARVYNRAFICALRHGLLYCHYGMSTRFACYGLINHMFPITPIELGEGFIIGKERILTAVSRDFVTDTKPLKIVGFDAEGKVFANVATMQQLPGGKWKISVKLNDWHASCAIVLSGAPTPFDENLQEIKKK